MGLIIHCLCPWGFTGRAQILGPEISSWWEGLYQLLLYTATAVSQATPKLSNFNHHHSNLLFLFILWVNWTFLDHLVWAHSSGCIQLTIGLPWARSFKVALATCLGIAGDSWKVGLSPSSWPHTIQNMSYLHGSFQGLLRPLFRSHSMALAQCSVCQSKPQG